MGRCNFISMFLFEKKTKESSNGYSVCEMSLLGMLRLKRLVKFASHVATCINHQLTDLLFLRFSMFEEILKMSQGHVFRM